jgi:predicted lipoprotein with Yx(FWY)xxD motif
MKVPAIAAVGLTALITLSACGSGSSSTSQAVPKAGSSGGPAAGSGLHVASTSLGNVLVDAQGRTVYMFTPDSAGKSTCDSSCLQYWPPVAPGKAASTVTGKVASTTTTTGGRIATVGGWPVYTFIEDGKPGDVAGEGFSDFGGTWYAVSPSGQPVKSASTSSSGSAPAQGGGY